MVHLPHTSPSVVEVDPLLRPFRSAEAVARMLRFPPGLRLRFPLVCPLLPGTPAHAVLAGAPSLPGSVFAICDFRRILKPPWAPFQVIEVPAIVTPELLGDLLDSVLPHLAPYRAIYVDQQRLFQGASVACTACTLTFVGWRTPAFSRHSQVQPAVLDTHAATVWRGGFRQVYTTAPRARTGASTSTTTTAMPLADPDHCESAEGYPAGVGLPISSGSASSSSCIPAPCLGPATNPGLLDFVSDPLAAHRFDSSEFGRAFTLFDSALQTRLAFKSPDWTVRDCAMEAVRHFAHLGPGAVIHTLVDEVTGLPTPQFAAIAAPLSPKLRPLPIDARRVGLGICVVDVPSSTTPYTAVYWAKSSCPLGNLPPKLAKGLVSARTFGRPLPPLVLMAPHVDSLTIWTCSAPIRPVSARSPAPQALDLRQDLRDIAEQAFLHSDSTSVMVHWPGGAPLELVVSRFHTRADMEDAASLAVWPLRFHADLNLHTFGTFPCGTDALLHFAVEFDGLCGAATTLFLFDGRGLQPVGPPFRTALLPTVSTRARILETARALFSEATRPFSFLVNGRPPIPRDVRHYSFPLIRLQPFDDDASQPSLKDPSCLPAEPLISLFPALALEPQHWVNIVLFGDPMACAIEVTSVPPGPAASSSSELATSEDPIPFFLEVFPASPFVEQTELAIFSLHFQAFRLWVPVLTTAPQLRQAISQATGREIVRLRWPRVVPCVPGHPLLVVAITPEDDPSATLGVVDARPVFPLQGPALWLIALPDCVQSRDLTQLALADRQVACTPVCTRIDGRRCNGALSFRKGIFLLTISSGSVQEDPAIDRQHPCQLPIGLQFGDDHTSGTSTTTTTEGWTTEPFLRTSTTTTSLPHGEEPRVTIYATSGLMQPLAIHAGEGLSCDALLASCTCHFFERRVVPPFTTWLLAKRAFQLCNGRWALFLCTGHSTHEPSALVWIDAGDAWPHPYTIYVPCYATWRQIRSRIYLPLSDDVIVTVNGVVWDGSRLFFANAFVIQVRSSTAALRSRSLLSFSDRLDGLLALQCNCEGPITANWDALPRVEQRRLFREHFQNWFRLARAFTESVFPFARVLLLVQGTGNFRFTVGTRLPPTVLQVQEHFDAFLAPRLGNGVVEDLKFVWGEDHLFVVRLPETVGSYWIQLDGEFVDTWELDPLQDLSQVPTREGHVCALSR